MKRSSKILITTIAVIGITAGSLSLVSAQGRWGDGCRYSGPQAMQGYGKHMRGQSKMAGMRGGMQQDPAQSLDRMKTILQITQDQEPAWNEFASTMQSKFETRKAHREMRLSGEFSAQDRIGLMKQRAEQMTEMANAMEKLYASLTPAQQKVVDTIGPMGRGMGRGFGRQF